MKRIVILLMAIALLSSCYSGTWHDVTYKVTGSGISKAGIRVISAVTRLDKYEIRDIPWSITSTIGFGEYGLYADTGTEISGTITAAILIDGVVGDTATATANGSPASLLISVSIPEL